jgi:hypothetical protein
MATQPADIREFVESLPAPDAIRAKIEAKRQETAFLKRLLKIAVDAKKSETTGAQK